MNNYKQNLIILLIISIYLVFVKFTNIRICLIYNLFHIPCPACGLTRAYFALLNGDLILSLKYNILAIPIAIFFTIYFIFTLKDAINKTNYTEEFLSKYKFLSIILVVLFVAISWILNLTKSFLY